MSDPQNAPLVDEIAELYQEFQDTLGKISHEHLDASRAVIQKVDELEQEDIRAKIQAEKT